MPGIYEEKCGIVGTMFMRRRLPNTLSIFLISCGFTVLIFMLKHLYDMHQKCHRLETYKQYVQELTDYMQNVEQSANKSAQNLHRLSSAVQQRLSILTDTEVHNDAGR